ncbi:MAG TPA: reverse transcriptase family protein [Rhodanobacteraceae bacterium]|nr:reverse transcriptase family protein [Rhodanobacteraceae bacterium]
MPDRAHVLARRLALALVDGALDEAAVRERILRAFRPITPWLVDAALRHAPFAEGADRDALVARLVADEVFMRHAARAPAVRWRRVPLGPRIEPEARLAVADVPRFATSAALAHWLHLAPGELAWFADAWREGGRDDERLRHYRYRWKPREYGPDRLLEIPKPHLAMIQRRIDTAILRRVPVHEAACGFVRGRSALAHARRHAGREVVLRIDLEQFFTTIAAARVGGVFRLIGYDDAIARALTALVTHRVPMRVLMAAPHAIAWADCRRWREAHLPQGAPSSPTLANLVAWSLDARLVAWARARGLVYSRYADDLTFSGDGISRARWNGFVLAIARIAEDAGFRVNHRKTRLFARPAAQRVTGLVVNRHANVARAEFDRLKAILTNCVRHGAVSQNREGRADFRARLAGLVAWHHSVNPARTARLERLFAQIAWN